MTFYSEPRKHWFCCRGAEAGCIVCEKRGEVVVYFIGGGGYDWKEGGVQHRGEYVMHTTINFTHFVAAKKAVKTYVDRVHAEDRARQLAARTVQPPRSRAKGGATA